MSKTWQENEDSHNSKSGKTERIKAVNVRGSSGSHDASQTPHPSLCSAWCHFSWLHPLRMNDVFNLFLLIPEKIATSFHAHTHLIKMHFSRSKRSLISSYWPYWAYWYAQRRSWFMKMKWVNGISNTMKGGLDLLHSKITMHQPFLRASAPLGNKLQNKGENRFLNSLTSVKGIKYETEAAPHGYECTNWSRPWKIVGFLSVPTLL